jgi:hypothetical protein
MLISKSFLLLKIQTNSKKRGFRKEKSVENVVTLGPTAQATIVMMGDQQWCNHQLLALYPLPCCTFRRCLLVEETTSLKEGKPTIRILHQFFGRLHSPQLKKINDVNLPNFIPRKQCSTQRT